MEQTIITIIAEHTGHKFRGVTTEKHLENDLNCDSLDHLEIAMELEDEFDIHITDEECNKWSLVSDVIKTVEEKKTTKVVK